MRSCPTSQEGQQLTLYSADFETTLQPRHCLLSPTTKTTTTTSRMIFELEQVQTSYNLPTFPPLPPRPSPRRRPIPLPLLAGPKLIPLPPDPQPLNTQPASIQQPTTSNWTPRKAYRRSPLGPPYLGERGPPISRRYIRPPPPNSIVQCQAFHTPRLGEDSVFEDWVARALQRRIGEKVAKARRVGDKLGMGVNAGREMRIWAHLSGLEKLKREAGEFCHRREEGRRKLR